MVRTRTHVGVPLQLHTPVTFHLRWPPMCAHDLRAIGRVVLLALCGLNAATLARAEPAPSAGPSFSWVRLPGAESCIAQADLAARIEARMRRAVFVRPADALVLVEGRIGPATGGGFEAVIAVSDPAGQLFGERVLPLASGDCRALDDMVALVIAVTLRGSASGVPLPKEISAQLEALFGDEPSTLDPNTLPPPAPEPSRAAPADQPGRAPAHNEKAADAPALAFGLDVGMAMVTGLQPKGTLAPAAELRLAWHDLVVATAGGGMGLEQEQTVDDGAIDGTIEQGLWYLALSGCIVALRPSFGGGLELCARFALGELQAQASDFAVENLALDQVWTELGPELNVRAPLVWPLYVRVGLGLPVRLSQPELIYRRSNDQLTSAFEVAPVGFLGELALGVSLP
jgi:hypothetical protein